MVPIDDAEVPSHVQVQTLPSQSVETVNVVHSGPQLSDSQLCDLREVCVDFQSLLTDQPGWPIDVEDHSVLLMPDVPVRLKPYSLPFNMKEVVEKKI